MIGDIATKRRISTLGPFTAILLVLLLLGYSVPSSLLADQFGVDGLTMMGYINQSIGYTWYDDNPNNKSDFNQFLTQALLETKYAPQSNVSMFLSLKFNADWAYEIYSDNKEWKEKEFNKARDRLFILNDFRDVVGEAHVTWKPSSSVYLRLGKQIVQWGQSDGFLLMNQINPVDQRRGITDTSFESSLIPIWLVNAQVAVSRSILPDWLEDVNIQGLFDPCVDFAKNEAIELGNDVSGIWAPHLLLGPKTYLGSYRDFSDLSLTSKVKEPDSFDSDGQAFGLKIDGTVANAKVTLNGYYGRSHEMVRSGAFGADVTPFVWDNGATVHPWYVAKYPLFRFVGTTVTREADWMRAAFLGNVAPVFRFEALYAFNTTFSTNNNNFAYYQAKKGDIFWESDEFRAMIGADWKVRIRPLNNRSFFFISGQYYWRHINDFPGNDASGAAQFVGTYTTDKVKQDTHTTSLMVKTAYLLNHLQPSFFWLRNWTSESQFFKYELAYEWDSHWKFTVGAFLLDGVNTTWDLEPFENKDHAYLTASYRF
jgi:hypothetical protein